MQEYNGYLLPPQSINYEEGGFEPLADLLRLAQEKPHQIIEGTDRFGVGVVSSLVELIRGLDNLKQVVDKNRTQIEATLPKLSSYILLNPDLIGLGRVLLEVYRVWSTNTDNPNDFNNGSD